MWEVDQPPRAQPAPLSKDDKIDELETDIEELMNQIADLEKERTQLQEERKLENETAPPETP
jgi:outer membrane murein-binding lipoprotein Lpp